MNKVINIPTIGTGQRGFEILSRIWKDAESSPCDIIFEFPKCEFLGPSAVAFLGGLARLVERKDRKVSFNWESVTEKVKMNLCQNGFAKTFGYETSGWEGNSIPYREDNFKNINEKVMNGIMDYLTDSWIGRGWVLVSERLRDAIAGNLWEIYDNAFKHSGSEVGVFSCGQHFPRKRELVLSVVDFGQGIPNKVRNFFLQFDSRAEKFSATSCLKWAFQLGSSTNPGITQGVGLDLLKEFIIVNQGKLEVYSNEGYVIIDNNGDRYENRSILFNGTLFHIILKCDERYYKFKYEDEPNS